MSESQSAEIVIALVVANITRGKWWNCLRDEILRLNVEHVQLMSAKVFRTR